MGRRKALKLNKLLSSVHRAFCRASLLLVLGAAITSTRVTAQTITTGQTRVLLLIDRSGSVHFDVDKAFQRVAERISTMTKAGDELGVAYIHSQTEANPQRMTIKAALPSDYESLGGATQSSARRKVQKQLLTERSQMKATLRKMLTTAADAETQESSDVWGSLATMDAFFNNASIADNCVVFIISDLIESMPGKGRRDFHRQHPMNDAAYLRGLAVADVPKIRSIYGLNGKMPLARVDQLAVLFPASGVQQSQNNAMTQYWTTVFELLGLPRQRLLFQ